MFENKVSPSALQVLVSSLEVSPPTPVIARPPLGPEPVVDLAQEHHIAFSSTLEPQRLSDHAETLLQPPHKPARAYIAIWDSKSVIPLFSCTAEDRVSKPAEYDVLGLGSIVFQVASIGHDTRQLPEEQCHTMEGTSAQITHKALQRPSSMQDKESGSGVGGWVPSGHLISCTTSSSLHHNCVFPPCLRCIGFGCVREMPPLGSTSNCFGPSAEDHSGHACSPLFS
ncbi:hypothetical protein BJ546DRAFT_1112370 [Cryomyces antarcticus]